MDYLFGIKKVLVGVNYSGENFADTVKDISNAEIEVIKRSESNKSVILPKR